MNSFARLRLLILAVFCLSSVTAFADQYRTDESTLFDFSIKYPENWSVRDTGVFIYFLSPLSNAGDDSSENVNVVVQDLGVNVEGQPEEVGSCMVADGSVIGPREKALDTR